MTKKQFLKSLKTGDLVYDWFTRSNTTVKAIVVRHGRDPMYLVDSSMEGGLRADIDIGPPQEVQNG